MRIRKSYDVVVVGAGTAGAFAAIAAARTGAKTLLIEQYGFLGGTFTLGMSLKGVADAQGRMALGGVGAELLERARALGAVTPVNQHPFFGSVTGQDAEVVKLLLIDMMEEAGVDLLLHTMLVDALVDGDRVQAVQVANKAGLEIIPAKVFVDCTGDADLVARSGAAFTKGREDGAMQPATTIFRVGGVDLDKAWAYIKDHPEDFQMPPDWPKDKPFDTDEFRALPGVGISGFMSLVKKARGAGEYPIDRFDFGFNPLPGRSDVTINLTRVHNCDATDPDSLTRSTVEAQKQIGVAMKFLRKYVPGFENCFVVSNPFQLGIRETRRVVGLYTMTAADVRESRDFPDQVARGAHPLDIHGQKHRANTEDSPENIFTDISRIERAYGIPARSLISRDRVNLAVAGRCISATHEASGATRGKPACMATGHAAGAMAALAAKTDGNLAALDMDLVRRTLRDQKAVLDMD